MHRKSAIAAVTEVAVVVIVAAVPVVVDSAVVTGVAGAE